MQLPKPLTEGKDWLEIAGKHVKEFEASEFDLWDDYVKQKKVDQAFAKLEELGYYHDSGLYGWLLKER